MFGFCIIDKAYSRVGQDYLGGIDVHCKSHMNETSCPTSSGRHSQMYIHAWECSTRTDAVRVHSVAAILTRAAAPHFGPRGKCYAPFL